MRSKIILFLFALVGLGGCSTNTIVNNADVRWMVEGVYSPLPDISYDDSRGGCVAIRNKDIYSFEVVQEQKSLHAGIERITLPWLILQTKVSEKWMKKVDKIKPGTRVWITASASATEFIEAEKTKTLMVDFSKCEVDIKTRANQSSTAQRP